MLWNRNYASLVGTAFRLDIRRGKKVEARMRIMSDGICLVEANSLAPATVQPNFETNQPSYFMQRQQLLRNGVLEPFTSDTLRFTRDHAFSTPSAAAAVIRGGPGSLVYWVDENGRTLQDIWSEMSQN